MMNLKYFPVNAAWAFTFGGPEIATMRPTSLANFPLFFQTKGEAIEAAAHRGLAVDLKTGIVSVKEAR